MSRGITKAGIGIESVNLETVELKEVEDILKKSSGFIIGKETAGVHRECFDLEGVEDLIF